MSKNAEKAAADAVVPTKKGSKPAKAVKQRLDPFSTFPAPRRVVCSPELTEK